MGWELTEECADLAPGRLDCALVGLAQEGLELGEDLLDGIEVGTVGRKKEQLGADGSDEAADGLALVATEIIDDDDVARAERWQKHLLDIGQEAAAIDRTVDDAGGIDPIASEGCQESHGPPAALRHLGEQPLPARCPAAQARHVGLGPGLVDEDQPRRIKLALVGLPASALVRDVWTILLGGEQRFF